MKLLLIICQAASPAAGVQSSTGIGSLMLLMAIICLLIGVICSSIGRKKEPKNIAQKGFVLSLIGIGMILIFVIIGVVS